MVWYVRKLFVIACGGARHAPLAVSNVPSIKPLGNDGCVRQYQFEMDTHQWTYLAPMPLNGTVYATDMIWFGGLLVMVGGQNESSYTNSLYVLRYAPPKHCITVSSS